MATAPKYLVSNRRAGREYDILDTFEAGLVLLGTEVKSIRSSAASLLDAWCTVEGDGVFLVDAYVAPYDYGNRNNHEPLRRRRLLLHRREIDRLRKLVDRKGLTLVPLGLYERNGKIKARVAVARGKRMHDKRTTIAERESKRQLERILKEQR